MSYTFIDITTADVAFHVQTTSLEEMFFDSAKAIISIMVEDPRSLAVDTIKSITLKELDPETLLLSFLQEIIFLKDAENALFLPEHISIKKQADVTLLTAQLNGSIIDAHKYNMLSDVKAVTMKSFNLIELDGKFISTVIVDV